MRPLAGIAALALFGVTRAAFAGDGRVPATDYVDLAFAPGAELPCTSRAEFLDELAVMLASSPVPPATKRPVVEVSIARGLRGFETTVVLAGVGGGARNFPEQSCSSAKKVALLAVALFVDPDYGSLRVSTVVATPVVACPPPPVCASTVCPPTAAPSPAVCPSQSAPAPAPVLPSPQRPIRLAIGAEYRRGLTPTAAVAVVLSADVPLAPSSGLHATGLHPSCSACAPSVGNWLNGGTNDLALVRVRFIPFMNTYSRISATRVPAGSTVTVVGTGDVGNPEVAALRKFAFLPTVASPFPNYLTTLGRGAGAIDSAAPGDSGGPVFDPRGNVVAVNSYALGTADPSVKDANYAAHAETASPTALAWLRTRLPATSFAP